MVWFVSLLGIEADIHERYKCRQAVVVRKAFRLCCWSDLWGLGQKSREETASGRESCRPPCNAHVELMNSHPTQRGAPGYTSVVGDTDDLVSPLGVTTMCHHHAQQLARSLHGRAWLCFEAEEAPGKAARECLQSPPITGKRKVSSWREGQPLPPCCHRGAAADRTGQRGTSPCIREIQCRGRRG